MHRCSLRRTESRLKLMSLTSETPRSIRDFKNMPRNKLSSSLGVEPLCRNCPMCHKTLAGSLYMFK
eukprot:1320900-Amorphochlora_amoeboformis.AAC.1